MALRPPPEAIAHLRSRRPRWPVAPERWHVTLAFLGDVPDAGAVHDRLTGGLAGRDGFVLRLQGSGTFGRNGPVFAGVGGDVDALHDLAAAVARAVRAAGVDVERRTYRPHLTLGRRGHPDPRSLAEYRGPDWRAQEVELVRSDLGRTVTHAVLQRYPLG